MPGFEHTQPSHMGHGEPRCKGSWQNALGQTQGPPVHKHRVSVSSSSTSLCCPCVLGPARALPVRRLGALHTGWGTHGRKGRNLGPRSRRTKVV